jgi:hypothetical protein
MQQLAERSRVVMSAHLLSLKSGCCCTFVLGSLSLLSLTDANHIIRNQQVKTQSISYLSTRLEMYTKGHLHPLRRFLCSLDQVCQLTE